MIEQTWKLLLLLIIATSALAQDIPPRERCVFDRTRANDVQRIAGTVPVLYYFACQEGNPNADATGCIKGTAKSGLVVSINRTADGWACISGIDSTSGWLHQSRLEPLPEGPRIPLKAWEGWWERPPAERVKNRRNDRLLITRGKEPHSLRVSGRAYWYGIGDVVHSGQVNGEAKPVGKYLHVVEAGCVLDFEFAASNPAGLQVHQNELEAGACGGMNVSFSGKWVMFTPRAKKRVQKSKI